MALSDRRFGHSTSVGSTTSLAGSPGPPQSMYAWIFAGMQVPLFGATDNPMFGLPISQPRLVRLLNDRAGRLGVDVRWGHELAGMDVRADGAVLTVTSPGGTYDLATRVSGRRRRRPQ